MRSLDHAGCRWRLSAYMDDMLAPEESDRVAAHLRGCDTCRSVWEELKGISATLRGLERHRIPADLADRLQRVAAEEPERRHTFRLSSLLPPLPGPWGLATLASGAILLVVIVVLGTFPAPDRAPGSPVIALKSAEKKPDEKEASTDTLLPSPAPEAAQEDLAQAAPESMARQGLESSGRQDEAKGDQVGGGPVDDARAGFSETTPPGEAGDGVDRIASRTADSSARRFVASPSTAAVESEVTEGAGTTASLDEGRRAALRRSISEEVDPDTGAAEPIPVAGAAGKAAKPPVAGLGASIHRYTTEVRLTSAGAISLTPLSPAMDGTDMRTLGTVSRRRAEPERDAETPSAAAGQTERFSPDSAASDVAEETVPHESRKDRPREDGSGKKETVRSEADDLVLADLGRARVERQLVYLIEADAQGRIVSALLVGARTTGKETAERIRAMLLDVELPSAGTAEATPIMVQVIIPPHPDAP